jgi:pimeloyl-ACP methyl ester carboxylesterase
MKRNRKQLKGLASAVLLLTALWIGCSFVVAIHCTRRARPIFDEPAPTVTWGNIESLRLHTDDGEDLGAWFIDADARKPVVVLLHGNGSCRTYCLPIGQALVAEGNSVLLVTMRAHGDSTGSLNDFGYSARNDVVAAVKWLGANHPDRRIIVWGQSLGSAAAIFAARDVGTRVSGYILECPYKDIYSAVWNRLQMRLPTVLDRVAYLGLLTVSPVVLAHAGSISPLEACANIPTSIPVLILAGSNDGRAPPEGARAIAARIGQQANLAIF